MKRAIVSLVLSVFLLLAAMPVSAQDKEGTYIEEQGEIQDSLSNANVLEFGEEYNKDHTTTIVIVVVAFVAAGGAFILMRRKKKKA